MTGMTAAAGISNFEPRVKMDAGGLLLAGLSELYTVSHYVESVQLSAHCIPAWTKTSKLPFGCQEEGESIGMHQNR